MPLIIVHNASAVYTYVYLGPVNDAADIDFRQGDKGVARSVESYLVHLQLRNTMENLTCATVKGSAVDMYFRRQVELSNMYRTMEANNYDTAEEAIRDIKIG